MNRIDRLMATLLLLQGRRVITAEAIAAHFEVSLRTVYRDIAALSEGGVPVVAEAGVGYSLMNGYLMPPVMLTPEEASALFLGGELVERLTDRSMQAEMRSALLKIRSVLPRSHQDRLDRLGRATDLLIGTGTEPEGDPAVLVRIQSALARRRVLAIVYHTAGTNDVRRREIEPLGLVFYASNWHLIAYCRWRRDYRDFRTDRIRELGETRESFEGHADFSLSRHMAEWRDRMGGSEIQVRVRREVSARFKRAWMGVVTREEWDGDWLELNFITEPGEWLTGWLLGFGSQVEVLGPTVLLDRLRQAVRLLAQRYDPLPLKDS